MGIIPNKKTREIEEAAFSLFSDQPLDIKDKIFILHYPNDYNSIMSKGSLMVCIGVVQSSEEEHETYCTDTTTASVGGPVIHIDGQLTGLHYRKDKCKCPDNNHICNIGISINNICNHIVETELEEIKRRSYINKKVRETAKRVFKIYHVKKDRKKEKGTGFLIAPYLLMTCRYVIGNTIEARNAYIELENNQIKLDPVSFFESYDYATTVDSTTNNYKEKLGFTIISLFKDNINNKLSLELEKTISSAPSILKSEIIHLEKYKEIDMNLTPYFLLTGKPSKQSVSLLNKLFRTGDWILRHNVTLREESLGGLLIDQKGRWIGMHIMTHKEFNGAIPMKAILNILKEYKIDNRIEKFVEKTNESSLSQSDKPLVRLYQDGSCDIMDPHLSIDVITKFFPK